MITFFLKKLMNLVIFLQLDRKLIEDEYKVNLSIPLDASPYDEFVVKLDGVIKLKSLKLFNSILKSGEFIGELDIIEDLKQLSLYTSGIQLMSRVEPFSFFGAGNSQNSQLLKMII